MRNGIVAISILIVLFAGAAVFAVTQFAGGKPNPDTATEVTADTNTTVAAVPAVTSTIDTADWLKYDNEKFEYFFLYPKDWTVANAAVGTKPDPDVDNIAFDSATVSGARFSVEASTVGERPIACDTLQECADTYRKVFAPDQETTGLAPSTLGGRAILTETITQPAEGLVHRVFYLHDETCIEILFTTAKITDHAAINPTFDGVISSFTFINPAATLQSFSDAALGVSIKYPTDWVAQTVSAGETVAFWNDKNYTLKIPSAGEFIPTETLYNLTIERNGTSRADQLGEPGTTLKHSEAITIGRETGTKDVISGPMGDRTVIFVSHAGTEYAITLPTVTQDAEHTADEMLETFRFLP